MLFRFFSYISGMNIDSDIFKIQSNNVLPSRGRILISEPFLRDATFGRSVILLVDHTDEGSMGLVINKQLPLFLNDIIMEFKYLDEIPLYKGGPIATDTLFYLHTLSDIPGSISISKGLYKGDKVKTSADSIQEKVFEIEDYMKRIVNASNEDIIEFSVDNREAYIRDIVDSIDNYYRDKMKLRSVDFTIGSYNNKLIKVDPDRLVEVIQNIIENALKYGDGRRISMDINEEDGKRIVFSIKNTGCTLEKRELANIFESFYRGTNTGKQEGSGLGLYICRRLMHLMDGEIYADIISEDGEDIMNVMLELNM